MSKYTAEEVARAAGASVSRNPEQRIEGLEILVDHFQNKVTNMGAKIEELTDLAMDAEPYVRRAYKNGEVSREFYNRYPERMDCYES